MKLAVISDIHSNLEALEETLATIKSRSVDRILCLGDIVGYGANPNECIDLVRKHCSPILLGNHDAAALDQSVAEQFTTYARIAAQWTANELSTENKKFLTTLPYTSTLEEIFLVHASPYEPEEWNYIFSLIDARTAFRYFSERICFVGHSHVPGVFGESSFGRAVSRDERFLVNVGSVGQPRDGNPALSFGLFDTDRWTYENVRVGYDVEKAGMKILKAGLPRPLAERLKSGV